MVLVRSIVTVSGFTMVSRILGFCRDILIAAFLGTGVLADVFFVAFKIPNLFRRLFAEGAFNAAFVPQFAGILEHEGKIKAKVFAEQALAVLLLSMLIFVVCIQIMMPYWLTYGRDVHVRHANIVRLAKLNNENLYIDIRVDEEFEFTEITIYTPDHPGIFSQIAGAVALSGATIMDAKIVTMSDGMVMDSFSIVDVNNQPYAAD